MRVISKYIVDGNYGGPKARTDFEKVLANEFGAKIYSFRSYTSESKIKKVMNKILKLFRFSFLCLPTKEVTIFQFPFTTNVIATKFIKNKVAFVHDIDGIRHTNETLERKELKFLKTCRIIISHNSKMTQYFVENGIDNSRIVEIGVFDYLLDDPINYDSQVLDDSICYAGNLSNEKCPFIYDYDFSRSKYPLSLFGSGYNDVKKNVKYVGESKPSDLPYRFKSKVGLVWDGGYPSQEHPFQQYNLLNNPHKLPCYLSAGLPVIIWKNAAIREFVEKNDIGYVISSLDDLKDIDFFDYEIKRDNAKKVGINISIGAYTTKVINEVIGLLS